MAPSARPPPILVAGLAVLGALLLLLAGGARRGLRGGVGGGFGGGDSRRLLSLAALRDPKSTRARHAVALADSATEAEPRVRIAGYRRSGWPGHPGGYYVIEILSPKPGLYSYSVTINSPGKYTGTATLLHKPPTLDELEAGAPPPEKLQYGWQPTLPLDDYRIEVHELAPG